VTIPLPQGFKPAGRVIAAHFCEPPQLRRQSYTGRRLLGVKYEKGVQAFLEQAYPKRYVASPWLKFFVAGGKWRWCQPDGLLIDTRTGWITVVEIKYNHTPDAWAQLKLLYLPVLQHIFPAELWQFDCCEIVKWYDPMVLYPEPTVLSQDIAMRHRAFKVHIHNL
jgi:hypothetical protein